MLVLIITMGLISMNELIVATQGLTIIIMHFIKSVPKDQSCPIQLLPALGNKRPVLVQ